MVTLAYSGVLNTVLPEAAHVPANLAAAATVVTFRRENGTSFAELGLPPRFAGRGCARRLHRWRRRSSPASVSRRAPFDKSVLQRCTGATRRPPTGCLRNGGSHPPGEFRGRGAPVPGRTPGIVRPQCFDRGSSCGQLIAVRALAPAAPTLQSVADNLAEGSADESLRTMALVAGTVAATAAAGVGLAGLRLRSRSITRR